MKARAFKKSTAIAAAGIVRYCCYFVILFMVFGMLLSALGRQTFSLRADSEHYERAFYSGAQKGEYGGSFTVQTNDDILVIARDGKVYPGTQVVLFLMFALDAIPKILAFCFLAKVFTNVSEDRIFIKENASYLLYYGLLQLFSAVIVPILKLLICNVANMMLNNLIQLSTGSGFLEKVFSGIAFIVASYIIHYGISLQDEVDHTI